MIRGIYEPEDCECGNALYADDEFATGLCHRCARALEDPQRQDNTNGSEAA